jgi:lipid-binding SYLF domain-containing protein
MSSTRRLALTALAASLALPALAEAGRRSEEKVMAKRQEIDAMADKTLTRLKEGSSAASELIDKSHGVAIFDNTKVAVGVSGGGGRGVAIDRSTGKRTYMRMATVGVGIGLGGQSYQVVFAFQNKAAFDRFVEKGWEADTGATAAAGTEGANVEAQFRNGIAYWKMTKAGLMAHADIAGTKYWKNDKLN